MPIYEYECRECGHHFDALQKLNDALLKICPACGAQEGLRKQVSAPRFRLKGQGWYETDFKQDKQRNVVREDSGGESSSSAISAESSASQQVSNKEKPSTATATKSSDKSSDKASEQKSPSTKAPSASVGEPAKSAAKESSSASTPSSSNSRGARNVK